MTKYFSSMDISVEISKMYNTMDKSEVAYQCYMILGNPVIEYISSIDDLRNIIKETVEDQDREIDINDVIDLDVSDIIDYEF